MKIRNVFFTNKLALVLVLSYLVVRTILLPSSMQRQLVPQAAVGSGSVMSLQAAGTWPVLSQGDYAAIVQHDPFGLLKNAKPAKVDTLQDLQSDSELPFVLFGTIAGNPHVERAIIKNTATGVVDLYRSGELVGGARIVSITADSVVLYHSGELKTLRLGSGGGDDFYVSGSNEKSTDNDSSEMSVERSFSNIQTNIESIESLLKKADIKTYSIDGKTQGLKLAGLENAKLARELGLKNGDVIRFVNGQELTGKLKAYQVFKKARSQPVMDIELLRDGQKQRITFYLE